VRAYLSTNNKHKQLCKATRTVGRLSKWATAFTSFGGTTNAATLCRSVTPRKRAPNARPTRLTNKAACNAPDNRYRIRFAQGIGPRRCKYACCCRSPDKHGCANDSRRRSAVRRPLVVPGQAKEDAAKIFGLKLARFARLLYLSTNNKHKQLCKTQQRPRMR